MHEVRSFLGMANYSSKYITKLCNNYLRELTKHNVRFEWSEAHNEALDTLKQTLTSPPRMSYFDKHKDTYVTVDASPVGISAILAQKSKHADSDHHATDNRVRQSSLNMQRPKSGIRRPKKRF